MSFRSTVLAACMTLGLGILFATTTPAQSGDYNGDFMVRLGVSVVAPDSSADVFVLRVQAPGADAEVSTQVIPSATLTYFFTNNLAAELFCCFARHDVEGRGAIEGADLGDTWIFPPAVTLQYHFDPMGGFKPYVGAGVQYIHFFNGGNSQFPGTPSIEIDDAFGLTLQAGFDFELGSGFYLNADVKKTWLETEATWTGIPVTADVELDPLIATVSVGYRFNLFGGRHDYGDTFK